MTHGSGAYLVHTGVQEFAPYLGAFAPLEAGRRFGNLPLFRFGACAGVATCDVAGRVAGRESVTVPAGTYDAWKVVVEFDFRYISGRASAEMTYWYAPAARRTVKASVRVVNTVGPQSVVMAGLQDLDLELVKLELKAP